MASRRTRDTFPDLYEEPDTTVEIVDSRSTQVEPHQPDFELLDETPQASSDGRDTDQHAFPDLKYQTTPLAQLGPGSQPAHGKARTLPYARGKRKRRGAPVRLNKDRQADQPCVGQRYLNYEIRRRLARGSMGVVYEAKHTHLDRKVAIKFLSPELLSDKDMVYRFLAEAKAMARIDSSGIPMVFDFGQDQSGNAYLVMEYFDGLSLADYLEKNTLSFSDSLELAAKVSTTLAAAHSAGVVHRDLKPENILLSPSAKGFQVKLIDFGVCKSAVPEGGRPLTVAGKLIGTPRYMAPEQTTELPVTPKTDIYALGCVLYELIAGHAPFDGQLTELVEAHRHKKPRDLREHEPETPAELQAIVSTMLSKDPDERPDSGSRLAISLRRCKSRRVRASHGQDATLSGVISRKPAPLPIPDRRGKESEPRQTDRLNQVARIRQRAPAAVVAAAPAAKPRRPLPLPRLDTARAAANHGLIRPEETPTPWMTLHMAAQKDEAPLLARGSKESFPSTSFANPFSSHNPEAPGRSFGTVTTQYIVVPNMLLRVAIASVVVMGVAFAAFASGLF